MNKIILLDCDSVLLDSLPHFAEYMRSNNLPVYNDAVKKCEDIQEWEYFINQKDKAISMIIEWQQSEHFAVIPPLEGAVKGIKKLNNAGYRFVVVTSAGTCPNGYQRRLKNIQNLFGDVFDKLISIEFLTNKNNILKEYEPTFFVEDNINNAINSLEVGHKPILICNTQNQKAVKENFNNLRDVKICHNWEEITDYILKDCSKNQL